MLPRSLKMAGSLSILQNYRQNRMLYLCGLMKTDEQKEGPDLQDNNDELYERFNLTIDKGQEPLRIDKFLMNRIEGATRNKLQQAINGGLVIVNGKEIRPNYKVRGLDE